MSERPGIIASSVNYIGEAIPLTIGFFIAFLPITAPVLLVFGATRFGPYAILGYVGLAVYFAQLDMGGEVARISEQDEPEFVKRAMTALMFIYYNVVVAAAILMAVAFHQLGFTDLSFAVALVYPFLDGESARQGWPFSLAAIVMILIGILQWIAERSFSDIAQDIGTLRDWFNDPDVLFSEFIGRFERTRRDWI